MTATWLDTPVPRRDPDVPVTAEGLRAWQLDQAWTVAADLAAGNPFYGPRLGDLPTERSEAAFRTLPTSTKAEIVDDCVAHPPYGRRTTCPPEDIRHIVETSGTSGLGREIYALDEDDERAIYEGEAVGFWWAGVRPGSRVLLTLPVGMSAAGLWYLGGLRLIGANVMSVGAYDTERKVAVLRRYGADVVVGTPSYVQKLAAACEAQGVDPASLGVRSLVVAGESYGVQWARDIQARWGATLYEQYGCTERVVAWTCPGGVVTDDGLGVLHFPPELSFVEIVDPATGEPPPSGGTGEIITTPLWAGASPLLRFATRDRAEVVAAGDCRCGRPLPGIRAGGVHRYDDMMKIKGVNVWPAHFDTAVFQVEGVAEYRGIVGRRADGAEYVEVTIECPPASAASLGPRVGASIRRVAGIGAQVTTVDPGEITGSVPEGFVKVARWRDLRDGVAHT
ncbi:MAG: hypothetical protein JWM47_1604 [Acidimicrobiales bacterium]|nr:hypothetical protein [Acidimicrobiales bacterium]